MGPRGGRWADESPPHEVGAGSSTRSRHTPPEQRASSGWAAGPGAWGGRLSGPPAGTPQPAPEGWNGGGDRTWGNAPGHAGEPYRGAAWSGGGVGPGVRNDNEGRDYGGRGNATSETPSGGRGWGSGNYGSSSREDAWGSGGQESGAGRGHSYGGRYDDAHHYDLVAGHGAKGNAGAKGGGYGRERDGKGHEGWARSGDRADYGGEGWSHNNEDHGYRDVQGNQGGYGKGYSDGTGKGFSDGKGTSYSDGKGVSYSDGKGHSDSKGKGDGKGHADGKGRGAPGGKGYTDGKGEGEHWTWRGYYDTADSDGGSSSSRSSWHWMGGCRGGGSSRRSGW